MTLGLARYWYLLGNIEKEIIESLREQSSPVEETTFKLSYTQGLKSRIKRFLESSDKNTKVYEEILEDLVFFLPLHGMYSDELEDLEQELSTCGCEKEKPTLSKEVDDRPIFFSSPQTNVPREIILLSNLSLGEKLNLISDLLRRKPSQ